MQFGWTGTAGTAGPAGTGAGPVLCKTWKGVSVERRPDDKFNATELGRMYGKKPYEFLRLTCTQAYLTATADVMGLEDPEALVARDESATWLHRRIFLQFAMWCDVALAAWAEQWFWEMALAHATTSSTRSEAQRHTPAETGEFTRPTRLYRNQVVVLTERDLHCAVVAVLRAKYPSAVLVPGIGELPEAGERRLDAHRMGYVRGQPDLMILNPSGRWKGFAVEFKHPGFEAKANDEQSDYLSKLASFGWKTLLCNDLTDATLEIDQYMRHRLVPCSCCDRLFASAKHVETHLARKRKAEAEEDAEAPDSVAVLTASSCQRWREDAGNG